MKTFFTTVVVLLFSFGAASQILALEIHLDDNSASTQGHPVWVKVTPAFGSPSVISGTGPVMWGGLFVDTISHPGSAQVEYFTYNCSGNLVSKTQNVSIGDTLIRDSLIAPCLTTLSCNASFDVTGSGLLAHFQDSSDYFGSNNATLSHYWDFGDGDTSKVAFPSHTYPSAGIYQVCLTVTEYDTAQNLALCTSSYCETIVVGSPPTSCAVNLVDSIDPNDPATISFTKDNVQPKPAGSSEAYEIHFGDGSSQPFPGFQISHTYSGSGSHTATLYRYIMNSLGDTICTYIDSTSFNVSQAQANCFASFNPVATAFSTTVNFLDSSSVSSVPASSIVTYSWDFGDGATSSTSSSVVHSYSSPGRYVVSLTVSVVDTLNNISICTNTYSKVLFVGNLPGVSCNAAMFDSIHAPGSSSVTFYAFNSSVSGANGAPIVYHFDFGDGSSKTYTGVWHSETHTYASSGTYYPTLSVYVFNSFGDTVCSSTDMNTVVINQGAASCSAQFFATPQNHPALSVSIMDTSSYSGVTSGDSVFTHWDYGDGGTQVLYPGGVHTYSYNAPGTYNICMNLVVLDSLQDTTCISTYCDQVIISSLSCQAAFGHALIDSSLGRMSFVNQSSVSGLAGGSSVRYRWDFGDGDTSGIENPIHDYAASGSYFVCLEIQVIDTVTSTVLCVDSICQFISVTKSTPFCNAEYIVDTANSFNGQVYIWNTSTPLNSDPGYATTYSWDFGDGTGSTQAFPTHNYTNPGIYQVCLSITSLNQSGDSCTSVHCDSLGVDSLGNLIYKSSNTGFTLRVLNPEEIGLEESPLSEAKIYPNPASDKLQLQLAGVEENVQWQLRDTRGALIRGGSMEGSAPESIDVSGLSPGMYLIFMKSRRLGSYCHKIVVERR